jgi:hypothetical protein
VAAGAGVDASDATVGRTRRLVVREYEVQEEVVDVDGDCAAVRHRVHMSATVLGEDRSGQFVISDVWPRRGGS